MDRQEIFLCGEAIGDLVTFLHENRNNCKLENGGWSSDDMKRDIQTLSEVLLDPLINALLLIDREKMSITMVSLITQAIYKRIMYRRMLAREFPGTFEKKSDKNNVYS